MQGRGARGEGWSPGLVYDLNASVGAPLVGALMSMPQAHSRLVVAEYQRQAVEDFAESRRCERSDVVLQSSSVDRE